MICSRGSSGLEAARRCEQIAYPLSSESRMEAMMLSDLEWSLLVVLSIAVSVSWSWDLMLVLAVFASASIELRGSAWRS